ncbi:MAG: hypothetical protein GXN92_00890 [Candidatus Micrarchaeota archaeon]|nr:hypothetical protein [Candidatus Micrarchaeota archaeon]
MIKHIFLVFYLLTFFAASLPLLYLNYIYGEVLGILWVLAGMVVLIGAVIALYLNFNPNIQIALNVLGLMMFGLPAGLSFAIVALYWIVRKYLARYLHL